jgi:hypothetical protein
MGLLSVHPGSGKEIPLPFSFNLLLTTSLNLFWRFRF